MQKSFFIVEKIPKVPSYELEAQKFRQWRVKHFFFQVSMANQKSKSEMNGGTNAASPANGSSSWGGMSDSQTDV